MNILPAIDIKDGRCVRLYQGDYATAAQVAPDPVQTAKDFERAGARWLHIVDLDGARERHPVNGSLIREIIRATHMKTELGGGIRTMQDIEEAFDMGVDRVILGSAALSDPVLVRDAAQRFGAGIAVGIDAKNGYAAANGWLETSDIYFTELAREMEKLGVRTIIYTDIGRDGTLSGANLDELDRLNQAVSCDIIASGGVRDIGDIAALKALGLSGAICGKAIYEGTLSLADALETAQEE